MIVYDIEVFKYDWMIVWLDTNTRKYHSIVNDKELLEKFYDYYKYQIWVGYGSRHYDTYIAKAILCGFNPYEMSDWIINKDRKGWEFSRLLNQFPILNYDCSVGFRSLKELEAFMGHDIRETSVPFDIDRPLTQSEINATLKYCMHDVRETFEVFVETKHEFESHMGLIKEFNLPISMINKTKAQISAEILGASKVDRDDEFNISLPENLQLGKYSWIKDHFYDWAKNSKDYKEITLKTDICGVPHTFGVGGIHGSRDKYMGTGYYILADVTSYYPFGMVLYNYLSRNVSNPKKFETILMERIAMKKARDPKEQPRKIVLNATFGASKDRYNKLYDPLQANNLCIANQLFIVDLLEKLEGHCELIQSNTDGVLLKLYRKEDEEKIKSICSEWEKRTGFSLGYDKYRKVIQRDVNNYILVDEKGNLERKGGVVKKLKRLDNDLPIVNKAVVDYFVYGTPVEETVLGSDRLIDFQKITKISNKYDYGSHNGQILNEKVHRCFASLDPNDGMLYKKHKDKDTLDKTPSTPEQCFIYNDNIENVKVPSKLDKQWYIDLAKERILKFV